MQKQRKKETIGLYQRAMRRSSTLSAKICCGTRDGCCCGTARLKEQIAENAQERRTLALHTDHWKYLVSLK